MHCLLSCSCSEPLPARPCHAKGLDLQNQAVHEPSRSGCLLLLAHWAFAAFCIWGWKPSLPFAVSCACPQAGCPTIPISTPRISKTSARLQARFEAERQREALQRQMAATDSALHVCQAQLEDVMADAQVMSAPAKLNSKGS